eukprot:gene7775-8621_t
MQKLKAAVIIANFLIFVAVLIFGQLSRKPSKLFPVSTGDVSDKFPTQITPASSTFALWAFIYLYQAAWTIYSLSFMCRGDGDKILPAWFYVSYSIANISNICWLIVWSREHVALSFAILALIGISLEIALYFAMTGLYTYLNEFPKKDALPNRVDVWCVRALVQNGVIFYTAWVSIATCLNFCIALQYEMGVDASVAANCTLAVLLLIICIWFALENTLFEKYTRFVFVEYIVLIVGLAGIIKKQWSVGESSATFVIILLILSSILLIARLVIIARNEKRHANYGFNLKYIVRR